MGVAKTELLDDVLPEWLSSLSYQAIPKPMLVAAKLALLDTLAVACAGWSAEGLEPVLDYARSQGGDSSTLWGTKCRLSPVAAAFGNGLLAAALDYDIVHDGAVAHSHIVIAPALIALAQANRSTGRDFLTAYVGGCEMAVRLGLGVRENPGWTLSSVFGVMAGAAACARLLGLGRDGIQAAVGIASTRASGSQQSLIEGSFTKRLQTAFAARDAVESALLARCGVTGPRQPFTGRAGIQALYVELDKLAPIQRLGSEWHFNEGRFKRFPSCLCNHAAIIAAQRAAGRLLAAGEIENCRVRITPFAARLVGGPFEPEGNPQVAAQFSVRYSVANALTRGGLALEDIAARAVLDPGVLDLARRIVVEVDAGAADAYVPATVALELSDGSRRSARVDSLPSGDEPEELHRKAVMCFGSGKMAMSPERMARLMAGVEHVESIPDMSRLWD